MAKVLHKYVQNRKANVQSWDDIKSQKAFIRAFNTAMNASYAGMPKARAEFGAQLAKKGIKLTTFGNVSMSNATGSFNIGLANLGFTKGHYNIESKQSISKFKSRMDVIQENRPIDDIYKDKMFIEEAAAKLDVFYADQIYNNKSEEEMSDIIAEFAPELKEQGRKRLSYSQLRAAFEKLQKAGII